MCIKLSQTLPEDKRIWLRESSGMYSAKSGYYSALERSNNHLQNQNQNGVDWIAAVWSQKLPPKLKFFIWKVLQEALPVGTSLQRRKVEANYQCKRCGELETITHLFWLCPFAKKIWEEAPISKPNSVPEESSITSIWKSLLNLVNLPPSGISETKLIAWIFWRIWKARNNLIFKNESSTEQAELLAAILSAKEWANAQSSGNQKKEESIIEIPHPNQAISILYTDAAWSEKLRLAGVGCVFQEAGSEVDCFTHSCENVGSPLMAEALAIKIGLQRALTRGISSIEVRSDSQILMNAFSKGKSISELYGVQVDLAILLPCFSEVCFSYVSRISNCRADALAKSKLRSVSQNFSC